LQTLTQRGVPIEFVKEHLIAFRFRNRRVAAGRAAAGEKKTSLACEFGISRETLCQYLRAAK
jgi:hypothetical protein